jgi:hypothetical protein
MPHFFSQIFPMSIRIQNVSVLYQSKPCGGNQKLSPFSAFSFQKQEKIQKKKLFYNMSEDQGRSLRGMEV